MDNWKEIAGFSGYEVSDSGEIRNRHRVVSQWRKNKKGYRHAALWKAGVKHCPMVHKLVLEAFVGKRREGEQAHHKNHNPADNRLENLEWVTCAENIRHNRISHRKIGAQKLAENDIKLIRVGYWRFAMTHQALADWFGVTRSNIGHIIRGDSWSHLKGAQ